MPCPDGATSPDKIVNDLVTDSAATNSPYSSLLTVIVQVPVAFNVITPLELTVHLAVVDDAYVSVAPVAFVDAPAEIVMSDPERTVSLG